MSISRESGSRQSSGKSSGKPTPKPVFYIVPTDAFGDSEFNLIKELSANREEYTAVQGDPSLSILSFPIISRSNIDRIRMHVPGKRALGVHPTCSACISYGVDYLAEHDCVKSFLDAKQSFNNAHHDLDGCVNAVMTMFFSQFDIGFIPQGMRQNINMPYSIFGKLSRLASDVSVSIQLAANIAIMYTLKQQYDCNTDNSKQMSMCVESFLESVEIRDRGVRALMREYGIKE